jgi:5-methylcytosine-specific restriction endonuclease McrA
MADPKDRFSAHRADPRYLGDCPICARPLLKGPSIDKHHFLPKSEGGGPEHALWVHRICHKQVHALFTAKELARDPDLRRPSSLAAHPDFEGFIAWIRKQPPEFNARMRKIRRLRK